MLIVLLSANQYFADDEMSVYHCERVDIRENPLHTVMNVIGLRSLQTVPY
jgi:hypothetical protein